MCDYRVEAPLVTSWTRVNHGRAFYGCELYKVTTVNLILSRALSPLVSLLLVDSVFVHFFRYMERGVAHILDGLMKMVMAKKIVMAMEGLLLWQGKFKKCKREKEH